MNITTFGLDMLLAVNLDGLPIFDELLSKAHLQSDGDGNIPKFQVDNIKTAIKVALRLSIQEDSHVSGKLKQALKSLLDYGTADSSKNIREFLASPESQSPLILTNLSASSQLLALGNAIKPFLGRQKPPHHHRESVANFNSLMRQVVQDFNA